MPDELPIPAPPAPAPRQTLQPAAYRKPTWTSDAKRAFIAKSKRDSGTGIYPRGVDYDFSHWFEYFWKEVKELSLTDENWDRFLTLICRSSGSDPPTDLQAQLAFIHNNGVPFAVPVEDLDRKAILTQMLRMSFVPMTQRILEERPGFPYRVLGSVEPGIPELGFPHRILVDGDPRPILIGFRGEGREFAKVSAHGGALRKADKGLENTNQPWHPFSDPIIRDEMYLRKPYSGDNCLYTVISIADDIPVAIGFPLIEDNNIYKLDSERSRLRSKPIVSWNVLDIESARQCGVVIARAKCKLKGDRHDAPEEIQSCYFLGTESYLYIIKASQPVVNTQKAARKCGAAGDCRERGIKGISLEDFMLGVRLRRVHLGLERMNGIYGFIQECRYYDGRAWLDIGTLTRTAHFYTHHFGRSVDDPIRDAWENFLQTVLKLVKRDPQKTGELEKKEPYFAHSSEPLIGEVTEEGAMISGKPVSIQTANLPPRKCRLLNVLEIEKWDVDRLDPSIPVVFVPVQDLPPSRAQSFSNLFPYTSSEFNHALSNESVLLNGMKVIFDQPASVYPVTLEAKAEAERNDN